MDADGVEGGFGCIAWAWTGDMWTKVSKEYSRAEQASIGILSLMSDGPLLSLSESMVLLHISTVSFLIGISYTGDLMYIPLLHNFARGHIKHP